MHSFTAILQSYKILYFTWFYFFTSSFYFTMWGNLKHASSFILDLQEAAHFDSFMNDFGLGWLTVYAFNFLNCPSYAIKIPFTLQQTKINAITNLFKCCLEANRLSRLPYIHLKLSTVNMTNKFKIQSESECCTYDNTMVPRSVDLYDFVDTSE